MLFYRLKNERRNEKFMRLVEFDEHLTKLVERERTQQIEADRLKEYMENVCKIKVIVPALNSSSSSSHSSSSTSSPSANNNPPATDSSDIPVKDVPTVKISSAIDDEDDSVPSLIEIAARKRTEKLLEIHKDLTLEMAKEQIIKVRNQLFRNFNFRINRI